MMSKPALLLTSFLIASFMTMHFSAVAFAGGGSIHPINFSDGQQITSKSFSPVVSITDPASGWTQPWPGQEYSMHAHGDLAGASCETTQKISDSQGQIKANCKADAYGSFVFDISAADGSNNGTFSVFFTDPGQTSGSGFNEQTPAGDYTVHILNGNLSVTPNQVFALTAEVKQNGQTLSNYDSVDYIRWEVLQGSMSIVATSDHLDKTPQIRISDVGKTVIRATAVMKDNRTFQSGAITVTVANPVPRTVPTTVTTTASGSNGSSNSNGNTSGTSNSETAGTEKTSDKSPTPSPTVKPSVKPKFKGVNASASAVLAKLATESADLSATPSASESAQVQIQTPEVKPKFNLITTFQDFGKKIGSFFSHLWRR